VRVEEGAGAGRLGSGHQNDRWVDNDHGHEHEEEVHVWLGCEEGYGAGQMAWGYGPSTSRRDAEGWSAGSCCKSHGNDGVHSAPENELRGRAGSE
jgi:hypothetical protein